MKKEHQLAIIGAGQLGSRHLQALATEELSLTWGPLHCVPLIITTSTFDKTTKLLL